ncbi:UDP-N-acetylmuramoyl-L-alanine--D-glutamate ligase [Falsarthrobacter nasiphocae]|uniref:UDP-N-acetylmuramoylalanine--D-glutamate ligase n=1 Tax=Falsarthrobacter nasiphocae TaxID=189863 RepID=A0AAE3YFN0_9MICC|nr:UDP-N-acetylmuramoyl-L-alanine--D-glutamate ligase [Falsarthrobacter nasiphocae]MDR6891320.1 UDP-N-acetylmuramoylalanine--D-glutamate ligase [Falsarthrobacter nasiphocae]
MTGTTAPRPEDLTSWDQGARGLRVVVTGIGLSGFAAADTLAELGARVVVVDGQDSEENRQKADTLRIVGVEDVLLGAAHTEALPQVAGSTPDLVVTSPGWRPDQPLLAAAQAAGIPVWSEVELAWRVRERAGRRTAEWLVLTGTNGKTTTTQMAESILLAAGLRAVAAGNVGTPILDAVRDPEGFDVIVVELSSFQLHFTHSMSPLASAVLNLAEDHVDWHGGFEAYRDAKAKIYERTRAACVYNVEDKATERMVEEADVVEGARAIGFTVGTPSRSMLGVVEDLLVDRAYLAERGSSALELASFEDLGPIAPRHLVQNALAAAALTRAAGVSPLAVREGLRAFSPGAHRIEPVGALGRVAFINDSKATNPHAAEASLGAFTDVVWIAGGLSKGVEYTDLVAASASRLRAVVVIGTDVEGLLEALETKAPQVPVVRVPELAVSREEAGDDAGRRVMTAAVEAALDAAGETSTVLLAPAAASMDQFANYAARGERFAEAVEAAVRARAESVKDVPRA